MAVPESDIAAQLIERLLSDPAFRTEFRRDPAAACRQAGLDSLADEMALGAGKAMMTLDVRESKSSLAGVMMAAAMEGVGVYQFGENVLPHLAQVPDSVSDVLSRVNLPALPGRGALDGAPAAPAAPPAETNGAEAGAAGGGGAAAAAPAPSVEALPPEAAAEGGKEAAEKAAAAAKEAGAEGAEGAEGKKEVLPPEQAAVKKIVEAESPEAKREAEIKEAVAEIKEDAKDLPSSSSFPDSGVAPQEVEESGPGAGEAAEHDHAGHDHDHDHGAEAAAPAAPAAPVQPAPAAPAAPLDAPAGGGGGDAAAQALLKNQNLVLDADAQADIGNGEVDPRMIALLGQLTEKHKIELSVIKTGHDQFTSGGSVSNHFVGRGIDIARVDGEIVNPGSPASRELATEIAAMTGDLRPTEVGTPWQIGAEGFFTDGAHQDHLHVAFDGEPPAGFQPPAPAAPVAAAAAAAPGQPVAQAAAAPQVKKGDSMQFMAVKAEAAEAPKKGDSMAFMPAVGQPAAPVAAPAAVPGAAEQVAGVATDLSGVSATYPGDDASKEELAAWMAKLAQDRGIPPELPVMAGLVESGLENLGHGHADSVGFFQMRVGIWNSGPYEGYPENPDLQMDWFLDRAEEVKEKRLAAGEPIDDSGTFGEWVADIELPAEEYRGRYQLQLDEAQGLLKGAGPAAPPGAAQQVAAAPAAPAPAAATPAAPVEAAAGGGGGTDAAAQALLKNSNLVLDADAQADIGNGEVDPRMIALLGQLTEKHKIELSVIKTGHDQFTSGGSVSNHFVGRGIDIAKVDGEIVNPGSTASRDLATEIAEISGDLRPTEVGTPWNIGAEGFFTDGAHQDHLHVAFDGEPPAGFQPPAPAAPVAAAAAAAPGQPVAQAATAPAPKKGDSMAFMAVKAEAAQAPKKGDSMTFLPAIQPAAVAAGTAPAPAGPASALASAAVPGAVAPAGAAPGGSALGAAALQVAQGELGVKEEGYNTGVDVDKYLAAADVGPGNPWCASFVTWALGESGKQMEGGGWAAVQTWVRTAEAGDQGLQIVSAEEARPGDIVAYDWGGQDDFGSDGHIGFLESNIEGGKFTALEGNYQDAVLRAPRSLDSANVKFIRVTGDAPASVPGAPPVAAVAPPSGEVAPAAAVEGGPGSAAPAPPAAVEGGPGSAAAAAPPQPPPAAPAAPVPAAAAAAAPVDPAAAAAAEKAAEAAEAKKQDSLVFEAIRPETSRKSGVTVQFMKAIDPSSAKAAPAGAPVAAAAAAGPAAPSAAADASMVQAVGAPVPADELALQAVGPIGTYPGDNAGKPAIAKWLADEAERAGLPRELPVMAALVESDVQNLKGGDADSAGFFQMRVGIWDKDQYQGYRMNPNLQAKWFIDHALAVKKASGDPDFGNNPADWGTWIADVERPAAEYRYKYATRLADARALLKQS